MNNSNNNVENNILVIGDLMLDRYWFSSSNNLSREAPVPVVEVNKTDARAGGAANVALNIEKLSNNDTKVTLIGSAAKDETIEQLSDILQQNNLEKEQQYFVYNSPVTIAKHRIISNQQQLVRVDFEQKYTPLELDDNLKSLISNHNIIVISDYNKGTLDNSDQIIAYAKTLNKIVLVDPKGVDFNKYTHATLIKPNYKEFENIVGKIKNEQDFENKAYNIINKLDLEYLLVTCGRDGMILFNKYKNKIKINSYAEQVFDVTGAGDTVISSIACCLANNVNMIDAIDRASHAAAIAISRVGTSFINKTELDKVIHDYNSISEDKIINNKIVDGQNNIIDIENILDNLKKQNYIFYCWNNDNNSDIDSININKINNINNQVNKNNKIAVIINNQNIRNNGIYSNEELAYIVSKISVVNKVIYNIPSDLIINYES